MIKVSINKPWSNKISSMKLDLKVGVPILAYKQPMYMHIPYVPMWVCTKDSGERATRSCG